MVPADPSRAQRELDAAKYVHQLRVELHRLRERVAGLEAQDHRWAQGNATLLGQVEELTAQKRHWECESAQRRRDIDELCQEVGRLQRENQLLTDQLREETDATAAYQAWLKATEQAAQQ